MKTKIFLILFILQGLSQGACQSLSYQGVPPTEQILCGPGPEDMVLDTLGIEARLLLSCCARRDKDGFYGEIESLSLPAHQRKVLRRIGEPDTLVFRPHGIHLHQGRLYVISHERETHVHPILIYRLQGDSLFEESISCKNQHSPNAVVAGADGDLYFVNDSGKRGSLLEKALKLKRASIVRLRKNDAGKWESRIVAKKLSYPAGIIRMDSMLFAGDAIQHIIHSYRITDKGLEPLKDIEGLKGNDNLRIYDKRILTACHVAPLRFMRHASNAEKLSPVEIRLADPLSGESQSIFKSDGSLISGASTAIIFRDQLYLSQIFGDYILKADLSE